MKIGEAYEKIDEYYLDKKIRGIKLENLPTKFANLIESHNLSNDAEFVDFINCLKNIDDFVKPEYMPKKWNSERTYSMAFKILYDILHDVEDVKNYCIYVLNNEEYQEILRLCDSKRLFYFNKYNKGRLSRNLPAVEDDRYNVINETTTTQDNFEEECKEDIDDEPAIDCTRIIQQINKIVAAYRNQINLRNQIISKQNEEIIKLNEKNIELESNEELISYKELLKDFVSKVTPKLLATL